MLGERKRLDYIDWAKTVSILLIVVGHFLPGMAAPKVWMYSFHVPIFAILGGILLSPPKTWKDYFKRNLGLLKRLVVPYVIAFVLSCAVYWIFNADNMPLYAVKEATRDIQTLLKYFVFLERKTVWNQALWFLPCYAVCSFVMLLFLKLTKGKRIFSLILSALSFITLLELERRAITINLFGVKDAFGMKNYFLMLGFLSLGYAMRPFFDRCLEMVENPRKNPLLYGAAATFMMLSFVCLKCNENPKNYTGYNHISLYSGYYNDLTLFVIFAILLSVTLIMALMLLPRVSFANLVSRNSLFIMMTHMTFLLDNTFYELKPGKLMWETDLSISIRDGVFVFLVIAGFLWALDKLILQRFPRVRKAFVFIGIQ